MKYWRFFSSIRRLLSIKVETFGLLFLGCYSVIAYITYIHMFHFVSCEYALVFHYLLIWSHSGCLSSWTHALTPDWTPLHLFAILEHFQNLFLPSSFLSLCPQSLSLWQRGETWSRISVNTSEVVPEFKSFTERRQTQLGGVCVMKRKIYLETDGAASVLVRGRKTESGREREDVRLRVYIADGNFWCFSFFFSFFYTLCYLLRRADVHLRGGA